MFFEDASYKCSVDIVEKFCGIPVPDWGEFRDFNHLKGKNFPRRDGTAPRGPTRGGSGLWRDFLGFGQRDFPGTPGRQESQHQKRDSGFEQIRAGGRLAGTYAEPTAAGAADSGGQLQALLIRVVR